MMLVLEVIMMLGLEVIMMNTIILTLMKIMLKVFYSLVYVISIYLILVVVKKSSDKSLLSNFGFYVEDFIKYYYRLLPLLQLFRDISLLSSVYATLLALGGLFIYLFIFI
jgi:hypothetical protein